MSVKLITYTRSFLVPRLASSSVVGIFQAILWRSINLSIMNSIRDVGLAAQSRRAFTLFVPNALVCGEWIGFYDSCTLFGPCRDLHWWSHWAQTLSFPVEACPQSSLGGPNRRPPHDTWSKRLTGNNSILWVGWLEELLVGVQMLHLHRKIARTTGIAYCCVYQYVCQHTGTCA